MRCAFGTTMIALVLLFSGCGDSTLIVAIRAHDDTRAIKLLKSGANPNAAAQSRELPLNITIRSGDWKTFVALLDHGADPNLCDYQGTAALHEAAEQEDPRWLKELLQRGGNPDQVNIGNRYYRNSTPIFYAIDKSRLANAALLIEKGASLEHRDDFGTTPLFRAVEGAEFDIALMLLEAGADPMKRTTDGRTLFDIDCMRVDGTVLYAESPKTAENLAKLKAYFKENGLTK